MGQERELFCLKPKKDPNDKDILQRFKYNVEDGKWEASSLGDKEHIVANYTQISAVCDKHSKTHVFFQGPSGEIQSISESRSGKWTAAQGLAPTKPFPGGSIYAISIKDTLRVFYAHQDCSIHELVYQDGKWAGISLFPSPRLDDHSRHDPQD